MRTIELDIEGLPEPMVEALKKMVDALREHFRAKKGARAPGELPEWPGEVIEPLTRDKIYCDDAARDRVGQRRQNHLYL